MRRANAGIVFKVVPDPTVRALELAEGVCDLAENNIQPDLLGYLGMRRDLVIDQSPGSECYLAFNFRDSHLRDLRVRQAIAYAIDRDAIVSSLCGYRAGRDRDALAQNWAYDGGVSAIRTIRSRLPAARRSRLSDRTDRETRPQVGVQNDARGAAAGRGDPGDAAAVGIEVEIRSNEWATFYGDMQRGNFDLTSLDWVATDPHHYFMVFDSKMMPPSGFNRGDYSNPAMDRLLEQAM